MITNNSSFFLRFIQYQKERFPFLAHIFLIGAFTFSAISYSRICRGMEGFIDWTYYFPTAFTTITLFFLLRVVDEFKDAEDDANFRKQLPVPRGLISFKELKWIGIVVVALQIMVNIYFFPKMLILWAFVIIYMSLMGKEFFVSEWLKHKPVWYIVSHMFIVPLIDIYASGADWLLGDVSAPKGLMFFFAVSYMNGVVIEFGRKIKVPENEEHNTYSTLYGAKNATYIWIAVLLTTLILSIAAAYYAGYGQTGAFVLIAEFALCVLPALFFLNKQTMKSSKMIELSSAVWTFLMYMTLGAVPMISKLLA